MRFYTPLVYTEFSKPCNFELILGKKKIYVLLPRFLRDVISPSRSAWCFYLPVVVYALCTRALFVFFLFLFLSPVLFVFWLLFAVEMRAFCVCCAPGCHRYCVLYIVGDFGFCFRLFGEHILFF